MVNKLKPLKRFPHQHQCFYHLPPWGIDTWKFSISIAFELNNLTPSIIKSVSVIKEIHWIWFEYAFRWFCFRPLGLSAIVPPHYFIMLALGLPIGKLHWLLWNVNKLTIQCFITKNSSKMQLEIANFDWIQKFIIMSDFLNEILSF